MLLIVFLLAGCGAGAQSSPGTPSALPGPTQTAVREAAPVVAPAAAMPTTASPAKAQAAGATPPMPPAAADRATVTASAPAGVSSTPIQGATVTPLPSAEPPATALAPTAAPSATTEPAAASPANSLQLKLLAQGLTAPVYLTSAPDSSGRLFVVDQVGLIRVIGADGTLLDTPFLDLRDRIVNLNGRYDERGLLGLAFHPDYANNGRFFVYYSAPLRSGGPAGWDNTVHMSEFKVSSDPNRADAGSERVLLQIDEPQANHEGGTLAFGPDGDLYAGVGDGGGAGDKDAGHSPGGNGQDTNVLLGKILRIDVDHGTPYSIPNDNPFANGGGVKEVYAYGFRNPYRFSFDLGGSHQLLVGDVGQNLYEEVDIVTRGGNYGWNIREGLHCFNPNNQSSPPASCPSVGAHGEPLLDPIIEQAHSYGIAIVGGHVYRGQAVPGLSGDYFFGEWSLSFGSPTGRLFAATPPSGNGGTWPVRELSVSGSPGGKLGHYLLGLGEDAQGEVYVLVSDNPGPTGSSGRVYEVVAGQ